jgi:hypothetical protein
MASMMMMGMGMGAGTGARTWRIMASMMMMGMGMGAGTGARIMASMMMMGRLRAGTGTRAIAVGTKHVAGRYAVGAAPEFGSDTSAHILRIVRSWFRFVSATGIGLRVLPLGRTQSKHVKQNGGDIRHHDEGDEHDEPRENGEAADAQLVQQNGENDHDNYL